MKKYKMPRGKKATMIEALKSQLGIVSVACKQAGISRETHYRWLREDENYKYFVGEENFNTKDFGEHCLLKLMKNENPAAIIFFNKTRNKDRGYYEKQEVEHIGDIPITINLITKSNEEIKKAKGVIENASS